MAKLIKCKSCGAEIAKSAKICPRCGAKNKKPIYTRWWLWVIVAILVIGSANSRNNAEPESGSTIPTRTTTETTEPTEAVIEVSPADLRREYKENEIAADAKYDGKTLKITGTIGSIGRDILDDVYITIDTGEYLQSIQCYFPDDDQIDAVASLKSGETITIVGRCTGLSLTNVILKDCKVQ